VKAEYVNVDIGKIPNDESIKKLICVEEEKEPTKIQTTNAVTPKSKR